MKAGYLKWGSSYRLGDLQKMTIAQRIVMGSQIGKSTVTVACKVSSHHLSLGIAFGPPPMPNPKCTKAGKMAKKQRIVVPHNIYADIFHHFIGFMDCIMAVPVSKHRRKLWA